MAPLTAKRSLARFGKSKRWIFLLSPSAPAPVPSERWEAKHGIVERYGTDGRADGGRADGLSGSSNICFGRGNERASDPVAVAVAVIGGLILIRYARSFVC